MVGKTAGSWVRRLGCLAGAFALFACGGQSLTFGDGGAPVGTGPSASVGVACVPTQEKQASYGGSTAGEVSFESGNPTCGATDVCLRNHFEGRTSCPYGGPPGTCTVSGTDAPVTASVSPQCTDRRPADAVYCSCRCANAGGRTDDGASYCTCPESFVCTQLASPIGQPPAEDTSGAYCVKPQTAYNPIGSCSAHCDPASHPCP